MLKHLCDLQIISFANLQIMQLFIYLRKWPYDSIGHFHSKYLMNGWNILTKINQNQ